MVASGAAGWWGSGIAAAIRVVSEPSAQTLHLALVQYHCIALPGSLLAAGTAATVSLSTKLASCRAFFPRRQPHPTPALRLGRARHQLAAAQAKRQRCEGSRHAVPRRTHIQTGARRNGGVSP